MAARTLRIGGTAYPVLLPTVRDPRLHLAAVIVSLQVLGQVAFEFDLSIAQILIALLTSAAGVHGINSAAAFPLLVENRVAAVLLLAPVLVACRTTTAREATWHSTIGRDHPLAGRIWDVGRSRFVDETTAQAALARARWRRMRSARAR